MSLLADIAANARRSKDAKPISPLGLEAVRRIDAIFDLERTINGADSATRLALRRERTAPLVTDLERWMRAERERLSRHATVAQAMDYMLKPWDRFARFLQNGRVCLTNNAAERALRGVALVCCQVGSRKYPVPALASIRAYSGLHFAQMPPQAARSIFWHGSHSTAAQSLTTSRVQTGLSISIATSWNTS